MLYLLFIVYNLKSAKGYKRSDASNDTLAQTIRNAPIRDDLPLTILLGGRPLC